MNKLKLDLDDYLEEFYSFFSRDAQLFLQGDSSLHYKRINELCELDLKYPKKTKLLNTAILHLEKKGILHLEELAEFVKIISYIKYLKSSCVSFELKKYFDKFVIAKEVEDILKYFKDDEFNSECDERLLNIDEKIKQLNQDINQQLRLLMQSKNLSEYLVDTQIHYINNQECLLLRGGFVKLLKASIIARSSGGGFYVVPLEIDNLKKGIKRLQEQEDEIKYEYACKFSAILSKFTLFLRFIDKEYSLIDGYLARVFFAKSKDLEFIECKNDKKIKISSFYHPAIKNAKPISVDFSKQVLIITGVNAGGKSMLLKSIMSASFLAKYLIPMKIDTHNSSISSFKSYESIIEDPQNSKNDISTFAGRMQSFAALFSQKDYLLGIDEIELGTDFEEASNLFYVLINELKKNAKIIITTHHKRLAAMLASCDDVELLAALYDIKEQRPKYEFLEGIIGKSYAYESALRYKISPNIVNEARKLQSENENNLNDLLNKNLELDAKLKFKLTQTKKKEEKLQSILDRLKDKEEKLQNDYLKRKKELENEYFLAINAAKKTLDFSSLKDKQRQINKANELKNNIKEEKIKSKEYKIGDYVKYENIEGKIIAINKNIASVENDFLTLKIDLNKLSHHTKSPSKKESTVKYERAVKNASVKLDLHGLRSEEAIEQLDKFISDALISGFDEVMVYHGIGTGKLAYAVKEFLKSHKSIKSFSDAPANMGGFGAKIIKL